LYIQVMVARSFMKVVSTSHAKMEHVIMHKGMRINAVNGSRRRTNKQVDMVSMILPPFKFWMKRYTAAPRYCLSVSREPMR
jgi:hypothetical protein